MKENKLYYQIGIGSDNYATASYGKKYERFFDMFEDLESGDFVRRHGHNGEVEYYRYSDIKGFTEIN